MQRWAIARVTEYALLWNITADRTQRRGRALSPCSVIKSTPGIEEEVADD
jgi:hypothetical protein